MIKVSPSGQRKQPPERGANTSGGFLVFIVARTTWSNYLLSFLYFSSNHLLTWWLTTLARTASKNDKNVSVWITSLLLPGVCLDNALIISKIFHWCSNNFSDFCQITKQMIFDVLCGVSGQSQCLLIMLEPLYGWFRLVYRSMWLEIYIYREMHDTHIWKKATHMTDFCKPLFLTFKECNCCKSLIKTALQEVATIFMRLSAKR